MRLFFVIFLTINFYCIGIFAQSIVVVNIQFLIDNNKIYLETIKEIEKLREKHLKNFTLKEKELNKMINEIEDSKIILEESELNLLINNYNNELNKFSILIEEFNYHFQNQINIIRKRVLQEIVVLLEKYATKNNNDLIFDSTSYLIASNSIDITDTINNQLEKINFNLEYNDFEKN